MLIQDIDAQGRRIEREITYEEYDKLWRPFLDAQPSDARERQIYRDAVDEMLEVFPLTVISPSRIG